MRVRLNDRQKMFLGALYAAWFPLQGMGRESVEFRNWASLNNISRPEVDEIYHELKEMDLVEAASLGPYAELTLEGIIFVEENNIADPTLIAHSQTGRINFLKEVAKVREAKGLRASADWRDCCVNAGLPESFYGQHVSFLRDCGWIDSRTVGSVAITGSGYDLVKEYEEQHALSAQFIDLKTSTSITPQKRGHAFEKILAEFVEKEGWNVETNTRSVGEENDLIIYKGFDYFIVSCKWEKGPSGVPHLRDLVGKVNARASNRGILISMAGFTKDCLDEARIELRSVVALLFGPGDVDSLFADETSFTDLLMQKLRAAMIERKIEQK